MVQFVAELFIKHSLGFFLGLIFFGFMFTRLLEKRSRFALRFISSFLVGLVIIYFMPDYRAISLVPSTKTLTIYVSYIVIILLSYKGTVKDFLFVTTGALTSQHLSLCLTEVITLSMSLSSEDTLEYVTLSICGEIVSFVGIYFLFARRLKQVNDVRIMNSSLILAAVFLFLITFFAQRFVTTYETITVSFRFFDGLTCFLGLFIMFTELDKTNADYEKRMVEELMESERKRYELLELSMDAINSKCHDLKYAERAWKTATNAETDKMDEYVEAYDNIAQTGNSVVDNIITEKSLYCEKMKITFTYIVNGKLFDFMQFVDIAVLFGNALDNAIECVSKYTDEEKRIISLNVCERNESVHFHVENYVEEELEFVEGLPRSHKKDKANHGIGLKSIKYIVSKYGGLFAVIVRDRMFNLNISFPKK